MQVAISLIEKFQMWEEYGYRIVGTIEYSSAVGLVISLDSIIWLQVSRGFNWSRILIWIVFEIGQGRMSSYSPAEIERDIEARVPMAAANPCG